MSGETTAVKHRCAKCGHAIDSLGANPEMWAIWISMPGDNGETKCYHRKCVFVFDTNSELDQLRAENSRLKSERDEANLFRERNRVALNRRDDYLQAHKAALEKARAAFWHVEKYLGFCSHPIVLTVKDALATINELLQKGSK